MPDPLSSVASVINIAGGATESTKVLVRIFREFRNAPAEVHQWLIMLESLQSTLSSLQQCGRNLDPRYRFPPHLRQRLVNCVAQLQLCTDEVARADAEMRKTSSDGKKKKGDTTRRSWERAKWAVVGDHKMKKVMKIIHLYHFEFVMELLKILITIERTLPRPSNVPAESGSGHSQHQQQQLTGSGDHPEVLPRISPRRASHLTFRHLQGEETKSTLNPRPKPVPAAAKYKGVDIGQAPATHVLWTHQLIQPTVSVYWNILACRFIIRAGPVMKLRPDRSGKVQSDRCHQIGFGLIFSIYLPLPFRQTLGMVLRDMRIMVTSRTKSTLHWDLCSPRLTAPDAEIFKSVRAGSIENVKRLLSLGKASAKDCTIFGATLLHSASKSGSVDLVRLLIREGADVNGQDEDGESPLHGAMAKNDNYDIARTLIENGADLSSTAVDGKTPFHNIFNNTISYVLMRDDWLEHMLPDSEAMSITHFLAWSSRSTPEIFHRGHSYDDADLFSSDNLGRTCLHFAASRGNLGVLIYLLKHVSSENVEKKDDQGRRPLHYAVESSRAAGVIDTLVGASCNIYAQDDAGRTALHWAARWNNSGAVEKLIAIVDQGSLLSADFNGRLPSQEVSQGRAPTLYKYLRDLESSYGLNNEQPNFTQLCRHRASNGAVSTFSPMMEILGALALAFMMLFGAPD